MASLGASEGERDQSRALIWWTRGPSDHKSSTCMNTHLSDVIAAVRSWVITAEIIPDRWIFDLTTIVRSKSYEREEAAPFLIHEMRTHLGPSITIQRSSDGDVDSPKDVKSRSTPSDRTAEDHLRSFKCVLRDGRNRLRLNLKFSLFAKPIRVSFVRECSWLISASIKCLKSNFDRKRRKKSHLEL